jgi:ubiquinone/menaquinone biosynthesis C-methylase UbiE
MNLEENKVRLLYDRFAGLPLLYYLDTLFTRTMENSIYRKKAIASLDLSDNSTVLDVACGIGLNFKIIESYLRNSGRLVGVDISSESLKLARKRIAKNKWTNVELVNMSITDYGPDDSFDAVLITFAMEIIPDYREAIDRIFNLLKPQGRFAMIGMTLNPRMPYRLLNPCVNWFYKRTRIDINRDVVAYLESKFNRTNSYEECLFGYFYFLSLTRS